MMNSFSFTLSGKHFICPSILNDSFAGKSNLGCRSLLFITLDTSCQFFLAYKVSFEKSSDNLMGAPLQITNCFSLAAFEVLSVSLIWHFNYDVSWSGPLCVHLVWDSVLSGLVCLSFTKLGKFSFIIFSNKFSIFCSSPSGIPMVQMLVHLEMSQRLLILSF